MQSLNYEPKVWGKVAHVFVSEHAAVSHLRLLPNTYCSRHFHRQRCNLFCVLSGSIAIEEWGPGFRAEKTILKAGQQHTVPSGIVHRFRVLKAGDVVEVYWPDKGGVVRLDDIERLDEGGVDGT